MHLSLMWLIKISSHKEVQSSVIFQNKQLIPSWLQIIARSEEVALLLSSYVIFLTNYVLLLFWVGVYTWHHFDLKFNLSDTTYLFSISREKRHCPYITLSLSQKFKPKLDLRILEMHISWKEFFLQNQKLWEWFWCTWMFENLPRIHSERSLNHRSPDLTPHP